MFYKVRVVVDHYGGDIKGPMHMSLEQAHQAARMMLAIHPGRVVVQILKFKGRTDPRGEVVETIERPPRS
jgi:inhibitor of KinA sporulation pathway (predicted exonuclease)